MGGGYAPTSGGVRGCKNITDSDVVVIVFKRKCNFNQCRNMLFPHSS